MIPAPDASLVQQPVDGLPLPPGWRLSTLAPNRLQPIPPDLARMLHPARRILYEWTDYWLEVPGADHVRTGDGWATRMPGGAFAVRFENQVGLTEIQPFAGHRPLAPPFAVEVLSRKFRSPAHYVAFLTGLLDDLFARAARLPFAVSAPTGRAVTEARRPPSPLFAYHFLLHHGRGIREAWQIVANRPHQALVDHAELLPFALAIEADSDVLSDVLTHPERWVRTDSRLHLARRLRGHAPAEVRQRRTEPTLDTPENRFVVAFLRDLVRAADALPAQPWWRQVPVERRSAVRGLASFLQDALRYPAFQAVGELRRVPAGSRVLMRREGYRQLLHLWQQFQRARRPLFGALQNAIDMRDIAKLYEIWCFFALAEEIGAALSQAPQITTVIPAAGGLKEHAEVRFGSLGRLTYNESLPSYSTPLRPDYLWRRDGGPEVALDAKFRLGSEEPLVGDPKAAGDRRRYPAIGTMHHYRDALGLRAAVVIYPGRTSHFYGADGTRRDTVAWPDLLLGDLRGVGAIALAPTGTDPVVLEDVAGIEIGLSVVSRPE